MARTRRDKVKQQKEIRQAIFYLAITGVVIVSLLVWGLPLFGKLAGFLINSEGNSDIGMDQSQVKPMAPRLVDVPEATSSANIDLNGFTTAGAEVTLFLDNTEFKSVVADDTGTFSFTDVSLKKGDNLVFVEAEKDGVKSDKSNVYTVVVDNESPEISINSPVEGSNFHGQKMKSIDVVGSVNEKDALVYVNERRAILDPEGNFSISVSLSEGDQTITVRAIDMSGNEAQEEINVRWEP